MNPWMNQPLSLWQGDPRAAMLLDYAVGKLDADAIARWSAAVPARRAPRGQGGLGVVPLQGIIMRRPGLIESMLGATSLDGFMQSFRGAMADPDVSTILMLIDSPGGEVYGLAEAAAEIRAARNQKRIVALADDEAASAAYWLASQASEVVVTPSGGVGAIECYRVLTDISAYLEKEGIKREVITGGPNKTHGASGFPLTDDDRQHIQAQANEYYGMYVADVAKARGTTVKEITSGFGQGRFVLARQAKAEGMVDRVDTLDGVLRRELTGRGSHLTTAAWRSEIDIAAEIANAEIVDETGEVDPIEPLISLPGDPVLEPPVVDDPLPAPELPDNEPEPVKSLAFEIELRRRRAAAVR